MNENQLTMPVHPEPGVDPPLLESSWSDPLGVLTLCPPGLPGLRKSVSWEVKPLSCEEMLDSRSGPGPMAGPPWEERGGKWKTGTDLIPSVDAGSQ